MAQELKVTRSVTISGGGVTVGGVAEQVVADHVKVFSKEFAANGTNGRATLSVDVSECKAMAIIANKDCTVKTNSTSTPTDTLTLQANKALNWLDGDPSANKFLTGDVTDLYVTTGGEATLLKFIAAVDSTPVLTP